MRIAIVNNAVPFVHGGAEFLCDDLYKNLKKRGFEVDHYKLPFMWAPHDNVVNHIIASRTYDFGNNYDRVIATKFPAHYIKHDNKVLWLFHQFRQAYDLYETVYSDLHLSPAGIALKKSITEADNLYLKEAKKIFAISPIVSKRLKDFNDIDSEILYTVGDDNERFHFKELGDFFFYPSRVAGNKRQKLAVEAMLHTKTNVRLVLAGKGDTPDEEKELKALIKKHNLSSKVTYMRGSIPDEKKIELFSKCLGCVYLAYMEDSYGFPTLESFYSKKPVIVTTDSGGTDVIVHHNETGLVVKPTPQKIAAAMDELYKNRGFARKLGEAGDELINKFGLNWDNIIDKLTANYE